MTRNLKLLLGIVGTMFICVRAVFASQKNTNMFLTPPKPVSATETKCGRKKKGSPEDTMNVGSQNNRWFEWKLIPILKLAKYRDSQ